MSKPFAAGDTKFMGPSASICIKINCSRTKRCIVHISKVTGEARSVPLIKIFNGSLGGITTVLKETSKSITAVKGWRVRI